MSWCRVHVFHKSWIFLTDFRKKSQVANLIKIRVVPCGQTYMTKLIVAFRNFVKATENATACANWLGIRNQAKVLNFEKNLKCLCCAFHKAGFSMSVFHSHPLNELPTSACSLILSSPRWQCVNTRKPVYMKYVIELYPLELLRKYAYDVFLVRWD